MEVSSSQTKEQNDTPIINESELMNMEFNNADDLEVAYRDDFEEIMEIDKDLLENSRVDASMPKHSTLFSSKSEQLESLNCQTLDTNICELDITMTKLYHRVSDRYMSEREDELKVCKFDREDTVVSKLLNDRYLRELEDELNVDDNEEADFSYETTLPVSEIHCNISENNQVQSRPETHEEFKPFKNLWGQSSNSSTALPKSLNVKNIDENYFNQKADFSYQTHTDETSYHGNADFSHKTRMTVSGRDCDISENNQVQIRAESIAEFKPFKDSCGHSKNSSTAFQTRNDTTNERVNRIFDLLKVEEETCEPSIKYNEASGDSLDIINRRCV
jgi:hypothetical protein